MCCGVLYCSELYGTVLYSIVVYCTVKQSNGDESWQSPVQSPEHANVHYCGWTHLKVFGCLPPSGVSRSTAGRPSTRRAATRSTVRRAHPSAKQASTLAGSQTKLLLTNRVLFKDALLLKIRYISRILSKILLLLQPYCKVPPRGHSGPVVSCGHV